MRCLEGLWRRATAVRARQRLGLDPRKRVLHAARAVRLRQDHAAAADRRLRLPDRGRDPALRRGHRAAAAVQAAGQHRVPELRAVPAHDRRARISASAWRCSASRRPRSRRASTAMLKLVQMEELRNRRTSQISGGQQQRVALARALAPQPEGAAARRAAVGARLQAAQGDADRAEAAAARDRHHLHLRHPRPGRGADHVGPHRGDVDGQDPAGRPPARHLRPAGRALRRRLHRRDQFPEGRWSAAADGAAPRARSRPAPRSSATLPAGSQPERRGRPWSSGRSMPQTRRPRRSGDAVGHARATSSISAPTRISMCGSTTAATFIVRQQNSRSGARGFDAGRPGRHRHRRRRRAGAEGLMAMATTRPRDRRAGAARDGTSLDRWLLSAPALIIIILRRDRPAADRARLFLPGARATMAT